MMRRLEWCLKRLNLMHTELKNIGENMNVCTKKGSKEKLSMQGSSGGVKYKRNMKGK
ncbi:hypothetical protein CsSME_00054158 [Camellia sinensis var. sinensis]